VFSKHPRNSRADQIGGNARIHARRHHQNLSPKSLLLGPLEKLAAVALTEIEIKEHDIDRFAPQNLQTFSNCAAVRSHVESRLRSEKSTCTLSKQGVIV
jgi:hypothetical protein